MSNTEPNWKEIALALGQRVNFAVQHLNGTGGLLDPETGNVTGWRDYMAEGMEMIPGVKIDREILGTLDLPPAKRKKAQAEIRKRRALEKQPTKD